MGFQINGVVYNVTIKIRTNSNDKFNVIVKLTNSIETPPHFPDITSYYTCLVRRDIRPWWQFLESKCIDTRTLHSGQWSDDQEQLKHRYPFSMTWEKFKVLFKNQLIVEFSVRYIKKKK